MIKVKIMFKKEIADMAQSKIVSFDARVKEVESDAYQWCAESDVLPWLLQNGHMK